MMGLNDWALKFVRSVTKDYVDHVRRVYDDKSVKDFDTKGTEILIKKETFTKNNLNKYTFPNGRTYTECIKTTRWDGELFYFLVLKDVNGKEVEESLWTDEKIESYI